MNSTEMTEKIKEILDNKKGVDIQIIDLEGKSILADYFIIVTGTSTPHVRALSEDVQLQMKEKYDTVSSHIEGQSSGRWILLDYGNVIVHIFHAEDREYYSLEKLWSTRYPQLG